MKKYKFFELDGSRNIVGSSRGHFTVFTSLPPEFSFEQLLATNTLLSKSLLKRIERARVGTIIEITKLAGWSSATYTPIYLGIKCIGEDKLYIEDIRSNKAKIETRLEQIEIEIDAAAHNLVIEKFNLKNQLKEIKEEIKRFDRGIQ